MSDPRHLSPSRLANLGARQVRDAFATYRSEFRTLTQQARRCFEHRKWARHQRDAKSRLDLYRVVVDEVEGSLRALLQGRVADRLIWISMKAVYSGLIDGRQDWDLAETFFNSVTRRIFATVGVDPLIEFVSSDFARPPVSAAGRSIALWSTSDPRALTMSILDQSDFEAPWADPERDAELVGERITARVGVIGGAEVLRPVFFRGKGAYRVGRLRTGLGREPFVLSIRNGPRGLFVDAVLLGEADVSMVFGFTRSYFHVDSDRPYDLVSFLGEILPRKGRGELYIAVGEPKQGKTELYRDLPAHLARTRERFDFAPGVPGLVMVVFTLPSHGHVLKIIRDRFPTEKKTSPAKVRGRYRWVYAHDRAGRIVDAQSFEHLQFPVDAFEPALLDHLLSECAKTVRVDGEEVNIDLAYIERKVRPLDLYLRGASDDDAKRAAIEYGQAVKDLAACGIFPGDLLTKNFGLTRHGRAAFYDYDEVQPLSEMNFRDIPEAPEWADEMSAQPWFSVGPGDVFPEEFPRFLGMKPHIRAALMEAHGDLFTAAWWSQVQERLGAGKIVEFPPYDAGRRLPRPTET